jgi:hypothetical protein
MLCSSAEQLTNRIDVAEMQMNVAADREINIFL